MKIITNNKSCCSCNACVSVCPQHAIQMKEINGFYYPSTDDNLCITCGKCQKVCPMNVPVEVNNNTSFYAGMNRSDHQRLTSTSGGIFLLLAEKVLAEKGVVYGAAYNEQNAVVHIPVKRTEDLHFFQGAKYAQSDLSDSFTDIKNTLKSGVPVLFSGTPCQVAGLKNFLGENYEQLITVDLVCHGIPSPVVWREYLKYRQQKDGQQQIGSTVNFRSKSTGWSHYGYSVSFKYASGYEYSVRNSEDPYMRAFVNNMILRPSCNDCQFKGVHRCSDFTLGDFWGVWDMLPELDDNKGTSLVLIHTAKGRKLWKQLQDMLCSVEITEQQAISQNPSLIKSSSVHPMRDELIKRVGSEGFGCVEAEVDRMRQKDASYNSGNESILRHFAAKIKRRLLK